MDGLFNAGRDIFLFTTLVFFNLRFVNADFLSITVIALITGCSKEGVQAQSTTHTMAQASLPNSSVILTLQKRYTGFHAPTDIAIDKEGNLYVSNWSSGTVTRIDTKGNRDTFVDQIGAPSGLTFDSQGNLYVADYSQDVIYKVAPDRKKTIFAQKLHTPAGISFDKTGNLLVANRSRDEVLKIDPTGKISTVVSGLKTPVGVVEDADGVLYITRAC